MSRTADKTGGIPPFFATFPRKKQVKCAVEVIPMKKQILLSFLAGAVMPLVLAALFQKTPPVPEAESESISPTLSIRESDREITLTVQNPSGNLQQMSLGEYLEGVVLAEMPADFEPEALKAQAVVARTYTRKRMEGSKHNVACVCMDPGCCQGWRSAEEYLSQGGRSAAVEKIRSAVRDTDGLVLCYDGKLIDATYFSCSGGMTEDAVAVWGQDVPYLQSVQSPGEEEAPRFTDSVTFSPAQFAGRLGLSASGDPTAWFGTVTHTDGGGVASMVIRGKTYSGTQLRSLLGLRSTAFQIQATVDAVTVTTRGFGHRVGMSQYGAQAMAKEGHTCQEILAHYYTGAELVREEYYGN